MQRSSRRHALLLVTFALMLSGITLPLAAQTGGTIRGRVTAANARALPDVQVSIVGTSRGALTNSRGEFVIVNVPAGQHSVRARMLGFSATDKAVGVQVGQTATVDFQLAETAIALDEIVVTGTAGQARRREVGNSIAQINVAQVAEPVQDANTLLQGRSAGVNVVQAGGSMGSGASIRLRGNTSVALSNQPLIYIDGVRVRSDAYPKNVPSTGYEGRSANVTPSPLSDVNPEDIERVEILKGAAATTLYGTEAAAGVIQIFTKRGHTGAPQWTAELDQGFVQLRPFAPAGVDPADAQARSAEYLYIDPWLRNGRRQQYALSVQGGAEESRYFVSGSFSDNQGVLPLDWEEKYTLRANLSFRPMRDVQMEVNTSYNNSDMQQTPAGNNAHGLTLNAFRRDRNYFGSEDVEKISQALDYEIMNYIDRVVLGGTVHYTPTERLVNRLTVGLDRANMELRNLRPYLFFAAPEGIISNKRWSGETLTLDYVGNLHLQLPRGIASTFSWGAQAATTDESEVEGYSERFPGPGDPTVTSGAIRLAFERRERVTNAGVFLQNLFGFKDRYFLTAGLRVDGNSAFGSDFGLQPYPKVSASWVLSEEPWWSDRLGDWKLRAAYGAAGRAPGAFDAVRTWQAAGWGGVPAFQPLNLGNPDLGPERTAEMEIGFDASLLRGRAGLDVTYYDAKTSDALFRVRQPPSEGSWASQLANVGEIRNTGLEVSLNTTLMDRPGFGWKAGVTAALTRSEVLSLGGAPEFQLGTFGWIVEGQPAMVQRANRITNPDAIANPVIETDHYYGPNEPTHTFGLNTALELPYGVQLSARGEYMGGHYIFDNASYQALSRAVRWPTCFAAYELIDAGRAAELTAKQRGMCQRQFLQDDFLIYPGDFFKLRDVTVRIPVGRLVPGASRATLALSGANWLSWRRDFPVFDPEMTGNSGFNAPVREISEHIPSPASFTASLRVSF